MKAASTQVHEAIQRPRRYIISGGGTGGHIFPALAIANEVRRRDPKAQILFVGAKGRMETEKVPAAGYEIVTLPVRGLDRKNLLKNIPIVLQLGRSMLSVCNLLRQYKPDIVIGVGGYVSAPTLIMANILGLPTLVQEQNSYAGVTNKLVGKWAQRICVAYEGMERFFPKERIVLTGNPIRQDLLKAPRHDAEAYEYFGLYPKKRTLLVIGGSLGARTINEAIAEALPEIAGRSDLQLLWQTGKGFASKAQSLVGALRDKGANIVTTDFVYRMDLAFSIADLVVSRAGASSISELCLLGLPTVLVPSPNVSEDHQTKNALALVHQDAALMVRDSDAHSTLWSTIQNTLSNDNLLGSLSANISKLALRDSVAKIVDEIEKIIAHKEKKKKK